MTALQKLIDKGNSGVPTPLETCILEQTFKSGGLAGEAAAELSLIKMLGENQEELLKMYRKDYAVTRGHVCDGDQKICRTVCSEEAHERVVLKRRDVLWRSFISTLDNQDVDWRASQQSLAISLLERFDGWVLARSKE